MKIDLAVIEKMVAAGASGEVVLAYLRALDAKVMPRRDKDRVRKRAESVRKVAEIQRKPTENERHQATIDDTPRARLFREGMAALATLGRADRGARALIAGWLKLTHDDDQLVLATILRARDLAVSDAAGWILATLKGKKGNGRHKQSLGEVADDLIARARDLESQAGIGKRNAVAERDDREGQTIDGTLAKGTG